MKKRKKRVLFALIFVVCGVGVALGAGFFLFGEQIATAGKFANGTTINGIDVSGLNKDEAQNLVATRLINAREQIDITLRYGDRVWHWVGEDFEIDNQVMPQVENIFNYFNDGNLLQRKIKFEQVKTGKTFNVSYSKILTGLGEKIDNLATEIDVPVKDASVEFFPDKEQMFEYKAEQVGISVDKQKLYDEIDCALKGSTVVDLFVPVAEIEPNVKVEQLKSNIAKRSEFSTSYKTSSADRKHNVKHALLQFNGMVVMPGQEVSFNQTTGPRSAENGYKKANIILNGVYVEGTGGGVCQASTTLYNALVLSDLEILEVNPHSLPSSYVALAFDAMVSEGYADLKFKNNLSNPIYIKTWGDKEKVYVEIYGEKFEEGLSVVRRADFVGAIPHPGDRIVADTTKQYSDKITFKGEYLRLKYPQEGYRSKAYLDYYKNGEKISEKLLRDETYKPQEGIIIEGTEDVYEGVTLPKNDVKFIPPQDSTGVSESNVEQKLKDQNPSNLNP